MDVIALALESIFFDDVESLEFCSKLILSLSTFCIKLSQSYKYSYDLNTGHARRYSMVKKALFTYGPYALR